MIVETFKVAGVTYHEDNIRKLAIENDDYHLSNRELKETYGDGDRIYEFEFDPNKVELIPEPENPVDPNAIRVEIDGLTVGHIKKGSCSHVKKLLASPDFRRVEVKSMGMGRYKELYEDEDGRLQIDSGEYQYCWVHLSIVTAASTSVKNSVPKAPAEDSPARDSSKFVSFASLEAVQKDNSTSMQRTNTAPRFDSKKLKTGPLSKQKTAGNASRIWGIIIYAFGIIYTATSVPVGLLLCAVAIGLLWTRAMKENPDNGRRAPFWVIMLIIVALFFGLLFSVG